MSGSMLERLSAAKAQLSAGDARKRLELLFDEGSFVELDSFVKSAAGAAGVLTGYGTVEGSPVYAFSQNSADLGGGMGRAQMAKLAKVYDLALKTGCPVVGIYDSKGARLEEGADALAAYGDLMKTVGRLSGVVPQVAVVAGVCAGAAAMAACSADLVIMSEKAELFMTAPFVAKAKGADAPGAGSAQNAAKAGVAHLVAADDAEAIAQARKLLSMLPGNNLAVAPIFEFEEQAGDSLNAACENMAAADAMAIVDTLADAGSAVELQPDFGCGVITKLATLGGSVCGIASTKGKALTADDSAKLARFVRFCDAFQLPVVTLVNTPGFEQSSKGELAGSIREAAKLSCVYSEATTPKVSVITGDAFGPAYIALAGKASAADLVFAWPSAAVSPLEPAAAVALLKEDTITAQNSRAQAEADYRANEASAFTVAAAGYIDNVIEPAATRQVLVSALDILSSKRENKLPKKHSNLPL